LPPAARDYLAFIAEETGVPVALVSVGSRREDTVKVDPAPSAAMAARVSN
jgi:adenylosuccinate synthase